MMIRVDGHCQKNKQTKTKQDTMKKNFLIVYKKLERERELSERTKGKDQNWMT